MAETYIALLYSIGIGGGGRLVMAEWRAMMEEMGLQNPRTLIATGNAVFESEVPDARLLEVELERVFEKRFGRQVDTIVRAAKSFRQLGRQNPFKKESEQDGARVVVRLMREPVDREVVMRLQQYLTQGERVKAMQGNLWVHFKHEPVRSRLMPLLGSKRLGIGTVRNWNTVRRLTEMLHDGQ